MKILFLSIGNINTIEDKGIYTDLLREFTKHGHNLYIISSREKRFQLPTEYIAYHNVHFLKVKIGNITETNLIEKGISTLMIKYLFLKAIKKYFNRVKFELIIYATPPITFVSIIKYIKKRDNAKSYLLLKDIFPQNAVDLKVLSKKNPVYWYFRSKEKKLYKFSDYIGCMSSANVKYILKHNPRVKKDTVEICPNSVELTDYNLTKEQNKEIRLKYGIPLDKTVFIYGGNLGRPQGVDFIIKCIKSNISYQEIYFIIAGSGTEFNQLKTYFDDAKPPNAKLLSHLPKTDYEILVNSCDVGLIFLDKRFTIPNFPSRLLSYMQASIPIVAATDTNTDLGRIIEENNFGYWCESGDISDFNKKIRWLSDDAVRKKLGYNAREFMEEHYTVNRTYEIIMKHFKIAMY